MPYKRGRKWVAQVRKKQVRKEAIFSTKAEALAWEVEMRKTPSESRLQPETPTGCSLIDWASAYLTFAQTRFTKRVYDEKKFVFKRFFKVVDPKMVAPTLTPYQALSYLQQQAQTRTGYAVNKERKNLLAAWNWGIKYLVLPAPSPFLVDKFPEQRRPRYIPPEKDFWKVYDLARGQDKLMLLAFLQLAARRSEVFRLRWDDVDFGEGKIRITTRKRQGGHLEEDWLPLLEELQAGLRHHQQASSSPWVFINPQNGQPFRYRLHWLRHLSAKAGVKPFGMHAIRHLSASILANEGVPAIIIQGILRHKNLATTQRYLHRLTELRTALEVLSQRKSRQKPSAGDRPPPRLMLVK
jgi:integrase